MKLATIRTGDRTVAVRVEPEEAVEVSASDVGSLLAHPDWYQIAAGAAGTRHPTEGLDYAPLIPEPDKIVCVGDNYRKHIAERGSKEPVTPTLFAKYSCALIGAHDPVVLPSASEAVDWEVELAVVIGRAARHVTQDEAPAFMAGYAVANDVSVRDWQFRTHQFLQGKTFERTTPLGPWLVTLDDRDLAGPELQLVCEVDGETMQSSDATDMVFRPAALVSYISQIVTLQPGDVILTGTPSGVGHWRNPPRHLSAGSTLVTRISGLGECRNPCIDEAAS